MKRAAFAALLFSAVLGGHAMADTGPTNPNPTTPGMGSGVPPEIPVPGSTDPRMQGSDPGRQGGATTDGTNRSKRPETLMDGTGSEPGTERNGTGSSGSGVGGSGTGGSGTGSAPGSGTGMGGEGGSMGGSGTGSSGTGTGAGSGGQ